MKDGQANNGTDINFQNTEIAFKSKTDSEINDSYKLFKLINNPVLAAIGPSVATFALKAGLPVKPLIKQTIFKQFCGGESIEDCEKAIAKLWSGRVGTILDYSVEGADDEASYSHTTAEIIKTIQKASFDERIPFAVFKVSGIARVELLEKVSAGEILSAAEETEYFKVRGRVNNICKSAMDADVPVMIDAEESWIQNAIDSLALDAMQMYNLEKAVVYNTYQFYLVGKLAQLKAHYQQAETYGFIFGAKLVRGAYMEKERERAAAVAELAPVQPDKAATDKAFNDALSFCVQFHKYIAFVAGTHNEESSALLVDLLRKEGVPPNHLHVFFSQLLGMSDHLSFNLAEAGYNVAKYVPYGPVQAVLPYLLRRAQENTAVKGQMGRELQLIIKERNRRGLK